MNNADFLWGAVAGLSFALLIMVLGVAAGVVVIRRRGRVK